VSPDFSREDWKKLAQSAIDEGHIEVAHLAELNPPHEDVRGWTNDAPAKLVEPVGIAVVSQTPALRWEGPRDAQYVVTIAREDGTLAAKSEPLRANTWTPPPLERGLTYSWQLTVGDQHVPRPPSPPALFAVLDANTARAIEEARAAGAHLVAAVLAAKHGAALDAGNALRDYPGANVSLIQRGEPTSTNGDQ